LEVQINEVLEDVPSFEENVAHYHVDVEEDVEPSSSQGCGSENAPETHFSDFFRLPQQDIRTPRVRFGALIDYSKSHILTSDQYLQSTEAIAVKSAQAKDAATAKKRESTLKATSKAQEKLQMVRKKAQKEKDKEARRIVKVKWISTIVIEAGENLQRLMKEGHPTTINIPYFGMCPQQCKTNQQVAMAKLKAKRELLRTIKF
jgi:hypothetical protein